MLFVLGERRRLGRIQSPNIGNWLLNVRTWLLVVGAGLPLCFLIRGALVTFLQELVEYKVSAAQLDAISDKCHGSGVVRRWGIINK